MQQTPKLNPPVMPKHAAFPYQAITSTEFKKKKKKGNLNSNRAYTPSPPQTPEVWDTITSDKEKKK